MKVAGEPGEEGEVIISPTLGPEEMKNATLPLSLFRCRLHLARLLVLTSTYNSCTRPQSVLSHHLQRWKNGAWLGVGWCNWRGGGE